MLQAWRCTAVLWGTLCVNPGYACSARPSPRPHAAGCLPSQSPAAQPARPLSTRGCRQTCTPPARQDRQNDENPSAVESQQGWVYPTPQEHRDTHASLALHTSRPTEASARPVCQHTHVLKWMRLDRAAATSGVVTTAARGRPLPMPFAIVTMSGTTPWFWKPQKALPVRPKPVCTSSAMHTPPCARTICRQQQQPAAAVVGAGHKQRGQHPHTFSQGWLATLVGDPGWRPWLAMDSCLVVLWDCACCPHSRPPVYAVPCCFLMLAGAAAAAAARRTLYTSGR